MKDFDINFIEGQIGYHFKNVDLLYQAFRRKSYAQENGLESNELLEFYGDEILDFYVSKKLSEYYGYVRSEQEVRFDDEEFHDEYVPLYDGISEQSLTELKKKMVDNKNLARIIDSMDLKDYMFLGKGDKSGNEVKVKADLFEAILGAIAFDTNWDPKELENSVCFMINLDYSFRNDGDFDEDDYLSYVQKWWQKRYGTVPTYIITECESDVKVPGDDDHYFEAKLVIKNGDEVEEIVGQGLNKDSARLDCAEQAYGFLEENDLSFSMKDDCPPEDELTLENAINVLQELYQKGWISEPIYEYSKEPEYDKDGNAVWTCSVTLEDEDIFYQTKNSNKKTGKKHLAYQCVCLLMDYKNKYLKK